MSKLKFNLDEQLEGDSYNSRKLIRSSGGRNELIDFNDHKDVAKVNLKLSNTSSTGEEKADFLSLTKEQKKARIDYYWDVVRKEFNKNKISARLRKAMGNM